MGWEIPEFAHLPLILNPDRSKLSKRANIVSLDDYISQGYLPEAILNFLALLGWNTPDEQEIFSLQELINIFSIEKVNKDGARFNPEKIKWFNHHYIQQKSDTEIANQFIKILENKNINSPEEKIIKIVGLVKERITFISDLWEQTSFFFEAPKEYNAKTIIKHWKENTPEILQNIIEILKNFDQFDSENIENSIKNFIEEKELGIGAILNALRLCLVGALKGPHLFDIIELLGKEETIERIQAGINNIKK